MYSGRKMASCAETLQQPNFLEVAGGSRDNLRDWSASKLRGLLEQMVKWMFVKAGFG